MIRHASRMILLMAGALLGGPLLMAQGLPNPLNLPDPLGITDSKGGHKDLPQPGPRERYRGHHGWRHKDRRDAREDRRGHRRDDHHGDHHGH